MQDKQIIYLEFTDKELAAMQLALAIMMDIVANSKNVAIAYDEATAADILHHAGSAHSKLEQATGGMTTVERIPLNKKPTAQA